MNISNNFAKIFSSVTLFISIVFISFAQEKDTIKLIDHFSGKISVTHNGISLIPSFSLEEPAAIFDLKMAKGKFSFEPEMRFALEGKPWSFLFWFRYKAIQKNKFSLRIGAHPALNFRTIMVNSNGTNTELIESRRFVAGEIVPSYKLTKKISVGMYYLYSYGLDDSAKNNHFFVVNSAFNSLRITNQLQISISPQAYYLKQDELAGLYTVTFISLEKNDFPLSLSAIFNKAIDTEILPEKDFTWNVSLVYKFK